MQQQEEHSYQVAHSDSDTCATPLLHSFGDQSSVEIYNKCSSQPAIQSLKIPKPKARPEHRHGDGDGDGDGLGVGAAV